MALRVEDALNYLRSKLADFRALPNKIVRERQFGAVVMNAAITAGDFAAAERVRKQNDGLLSDLKLVQSTQNQLDALVAQSQAIKDYIGLGQLQALPIAFVIAAITIAGAVGYLLKSVQARVAEIDLVARGVMTPEDYRKNREAEARGDWLGNIPKLLGIGAALVGGAWLITLLPKQRRSA